VERRIQSLRKLEGELEQAFERKRQQGLLGRGDVFPDVVGEVANGNGSVTKEEFYRKLIAKLDLIDELSRRYSSSWRFPKVAEQLDLLKSSFLDFLYDNSVREFHLEPGTELSIEERRRIKLVPSAERGLKQKPSNGRATNGKHSCVVETVRPGYLYKNGSNETIIRKAEVVVT
jgi:hypothetical protein